MNVKLTFQLENKTIDEIKTILQEIQPFINKWNPTTHLQAEGEL